MLGFDKPLGPALFGDFRISRQHAEAWQRAVKQEPKTLDRNRKQNES